MPLPDLLPADAGLLPRKRSFAASAPRALQRRGPQNVVVAVRADGHVTSVAAAAVKLASAAALRALFVHVAPPPAVTVMPAPFAIPTNAAAARLESQTVEAARRTLARAGLDGTRVDVQLGDPARQVLEVARGHDTALLVLGMPPPTRFPRLASSVGQRVIRRAPCPIILVPAHWRAAPTAARRYPDGRASATSALTAPALVALIDAIGGEPVLVSRRRASTLPAHEHPTDLLYVVNERQPSAPPTASSPHATNRSAPQLNRPAPIEQRHERRGADSPAMKALVHHGPEAS